MSDKLPQSKPSLIASSCIKAAVVIPVSIAPDNPPKNPPTAPPIAPPAAPNKAPGPDQAVKAAPAPAPAKAAAPDDAAAVPATSSLSTKALPIWLKDITVYCSIAVGLSHQPPKNALTPL